ncbi:hypothetical protein ABID59_002726 [Bradyrhizobium sp. S3.3.6]|uniref:hypothetical protein n=1 Tax=unclassified Bradyrhizobium TaxID=2631580 RepID=UPI00339863BC
MNRHDPGLTCIEALRKACETSLTATAIRNACLTRDGAAVILSSGETIEYCFMSEGLKEAKGISWQPFRRWPTPEPDRLGIRTSRFVRFQIVSLAFKEEHALPAFFSR